MFSITCPGALNQNLWVWLPPQKHRWVEIKAAEPNSEQNRKKLHSMLKLGASFDKYSTKVRWSGFLSGETYIIWLVEAVLQEFAVLKQQKDSLHSQQLEKLL